MTQPTAPSLDTDEQISGRTVDAVADMHGELQRRYTGLNAAEAQLAEALLAAHATSETGRRRLQDIQHQLVEAISNPVNALDTPAGERQFLVFLRSKVAEIQQVVDQGALTSHDQADVTNALANDYFSPGYFSPDALPMPAPPGPPGAPPPVTTAPPSAPIASMAPPIGGQPSSAPMAPGAGLLPAAAAPLSGLASLLGADQPVPAADDTPATGADEHAPVGTGHHDKHGEPKAEDEDHKPDDEDDTKPSAESDDAPPEDDGPAQTRPADG